MDALLPVGRFAILLGVAAACWSLASALVAATRRRPAAARSAVAGLRGSAVAFTCAAGVLVAALASDDFRVRYVAEHSARGLSVFYKLGAFWAGQEGSLLLWAWLVALSGALMARRRDPEDPALAWSVAAVAAVGVLFGLILTVVADPFALAASAPADGRGLNPLLRNPAQWYHPLTLYLGYVGTTIPFALAVGALATGQLDRDWVRRTRVWALGTWVFLTAGIVLGARWAYVELGWGGYWAWDPVENASLLPWLTGTAFLHGMILQTRRGVLRLTTIVLALVTFVLSLAGTFITRSGLISSVHAFGDSGIGPWLLGGILGAILLSAALVAWRLPELRSRRWGASALSRDTAIAAGVALLAAITLVVLIGTLFPFFAEAFRGVSVEVGAPFFDRTVAPIAVVVIVLAGLSPLLGWRSTSRPRHLLAPLATAAVVGAAVGIWSRQPVLAVSLAAVAAALAITVGALARQRRTLGRSPARLGAHLAHVGLLVLVLGVGLHVGFRETREVTLALGESTRVGGYEVTLEALRTESLASHFAITGHLVLRDASGTVVGRVVAERRSYPNQDQPFAEVGIRSTPLEDVYAVMSWADPVAGAAGLALTVNPGVLLVWLGGALLIVAGAIALLRPLRLRLPEPRRRAVPVPV